MPPAQAAIERLIAKDGLVVVGAEYLLETGTVAFFDAEIGRIAGGRAGISTERQ